MIRVVLLASAMWLACTPISPVVPTPPDADATDCVKDLAIKPECGAPAPAPPPVPPTTCAACVAGADCACCILRLNKCPEGDDTPKGETCLGVYADRAAFPGLAAITAKETKCLSAAKGVAAVRACGVKCNL